MSGGPDNAAFGGEDLAYQANQRANLKAFQSVDPNVLGRYETVAPELLAPKVIVCGAGHNPVPVVSSDSAAVLRVENRLLRLIITAIVERMERLNGGNGDVEPEIAACLADVRELTRQAVEITV